MKLTFVGTGASCAVPVIGHLATNCACRDAIRNPDGPNRRNNVSLLISLPFHVNPSSSSSSSFADAHTLDDETVEWHHVLIDCGKTFRNAYMRVLAPMRVRYVDALLLTHGHADAMHCVEELCQMQAEAATQLRRESTVAATGMVSTEADEMVEQNEDPTPRTLRRVPTYLTYETLAQIEMVSRELVNSSFHLCSAPETVHSFQAAMRETTDAVSAATASATEPAQHSAVMDLFFLNEELPKRVYVPCGPLTTKTDLDTPGSSLDPSSRRQSGDSLSQKASSALPFYSFPVEHGPRYISMCFAFGHGTALRSHRAASAPAPAGSCVVYISDVSAIPAASMAFLMDLVKIDVLVLDLLAEHGAPSASHYCADEAIPMMMQLAPRRVYFVGMFCSLEHHSTNAALVKELAELKTQCQAELATEPPSEATAEELAARQRRKLFVENTMSMKLAYDGQQLDLDS